MDSRQLGDELVDHATYVSDDRYHRLFTTLRRDAPVALAEPSGYAPFWVVSRHADIKAVEMQAERFINAPRTFLMSLEEEKLLYAAQNEGRTSMGRSVAQLDGQEHKNLRGLTQLWFGPGNLKTIADQIRQIARTSIDDMLVFGDECDFVRDVALRYPLRVIMLLLGLPAKDEDLLLKFTQATFAPSDPDTDSSDGVAGMIESSEAMWRYFASVAADRQKNPRGDVASLIANARIGGEPISDVDAAAYYVTIITAGHDTTSSTTAGGLLALLQHPDELAKLWAGASVDRAISEFLRWTTPIKHFFRTATQACEVAGVAINAGDSLMMCYPSANRDERVYDDPFRFDIERQPNPQLSFGVGPHICLGQHLAKLEIKIFYEELLGRVDSIELTGEARLTETNFVQGLKRLPIRYSAYSTESAAAI
jgi:cytochrome P450